MNPELIAPETIQRLAGSLLHFIWQGAVIAMITGAGLRMLRHRSAEARYAFAIGSLACMLAAPLFTVAFYSETGAVARRMILALNPASAEGRSAATAFQASVWAQRILLAWFVGVLVFATRIVVGWRLSWKFVKSAEEILAPRILEILDSVRERLGLRCPVRLMAHWRLDSPVVVGWLRPVVLLPVSLISGFTPEQLSAVFAHELAHIRRHDFVVNILQRSVESILFFHPAVWWLSKRIRAEREHCCDDIAIRLCGSRRVYAEVLIEMERARQPRPSLSVGAADGVVVQRFRRVLGMNTFAVDWQSAAGTLLLLGVWAVVGIWQSASTLQAKPAVTVQTATDIKSTPAPPTISTTEAASTATAETVNAIAAILTAQPMVQVPAGVQTEPTDAQALTAQISGTPKPASIEGAVTKFGTGEPLTGARVIASLVTTGDRTNVLTDDQGRFSIPDLPPGRYSLYADRALFKQVRRNGALPNFTMVDDQHLRDIRIELAPTVVIAGRVADENRKPLRSVRIEAVRYEHRDGAREVASVARTQTDDRGEYRLFELEAGTYYVRATPPATGPLADYGAMYYPNVIDPSKAVPLALNPGQETGGIDFSLKLQTTYSVQMKVAIAAAGSPAIFLPRFSVVRRDQRVPEVTTVHSQQIFNGDYQLSQLVPGSYDIIVVARTSTPPLVHAAKISLMVGEKDIDLGTVTLRRASVLRGNVAVMDQLPAAFDPTKLTIQLRPIAGTPGDLTSSSRTAGGGMNADGTFAIPNVASGRFYVNVSALPVDLYVVSIRYAGREVRDSGFVIDGEPQGPVEIVLGGPQNVGGVEGVVRDKKGDPVGGSVVAIVPGPAHRDNPAAFRSVVTDDTGAFSIRGLLPGDYKVFAWENIEPGNYQNVDLLEEIEEQGRTVIVERGIRSLVEARIISRSN